MQLWRQEHEAASWHGGLGLESLRVNLKTQRNNMTIN